MKEGPAATTRKLGVGGHILHKLDLVLLLVLIPPVIANAPGFSPPRDQLVATAESGTVESRILYVALALFSAILLKRLRCAPLWSTTAYAFAGYLALGLAFSDYPSMVLRGLFVAWTSLIFWNVLGYYLAQQGRGVIFNQVNRVPVFFLFWGLLEAVFWWATPTRLEYGYMGEYIGYFLHPNLLAKLLCLAIIVQFFKMRFGRSSFRDIVVFVLLCGLLLGTGSRTSLIGLVAALVLSVLVKKGERAATKVVLVVSMGVIWLLGSTYFSDFFSKGDTYGLLVQSTLAFRLDMWEALVPIMFKHPWIGVGLNSFWNPELFETIDVATTGIHNGYLQLFQDLGIIGIALYFAALVPLFRSLRHTVQERNAAIIKYSLLAVWIYFLVANLTEGEMGNYRSPLRAVLMTLSLCWYHLWKKPDLENNCSYPIVQPS